MLVFALLRLAPGDPAAIMAGDAATAEQIEKLRDQFARETDEAKKKALAEQIQARAFEIGTHAPLGEYVNPLAARRSVTGFVIGPGNLYWNIKKN